jgi:hypothetical protein
MSNQNLGATVFRECLASGGDIGAHLNELFNLPRNDTTGAMLSGALGELLRVYEAIRAAGHLEHFADADVDAFMHGTPSAMAAKLTLALNPQDAAWINKFLAPLVTAVDTHREKITFTSAEPTPPPPLAVQIVGMPERVTTSKVTYDKSGNITSTSQTESDASTDAA